MGLSRRDFLKVSAAGGLMAASSLSPVPAAAREPTPRLPEAKRILYDATLCIGCKACMAACPYGARYLHPGGQVDKCTFCLHRVVKGKDPACVETCPTRALTFGDLADPDSPVASLLRSRRHEVSKPEAGTKPNVFFLP